MAIAIVGIAALVVLGIAIATLASGGGAATPARSVPTRTGPATPRARGRAGARAPAARERGTRASGHRGQRGTRPQGASRRLPAPAPARGPGRTPAPPATPAAPVDRQRADGRRGRGHCLQRWWRRAAVAPGRAVAPERAVQRAPRRRAGERRQEAVRVPRRVVPAGRRPRSPVGARARVVPRGRPSGGAGAGRSPAPSRAQPAERLRAQPRRSVSSGSSRAALMEGNRPATTETRMARPIQIGMSA